MNTDLLQLDFSDSLQAFLDALFGFVNNLLNTIFTQLAAFFNAFDLSMLNISFG